MRRVRAPSLESLFVATFALLGLRLGLRALGDNSLFVHLRTGIDIVAGGGIPRRDPYSFTAPGEPWVVQSWLPEVIYGLAHRVAGFGGVRLLHGALYAVLAWLLVRLARTGTASRTALAGAIVVGLGAAYWSPRPLAFGLLAFAALVSIVDRRLPPWLLVPVAWVWVNSHGSFVLGLGWLLLVTVGQWLDERRRPKVLPWLGWFVAGLAVACVNPLGPRLLAFPLVVTSKGDVFRHVIEWRSPSFQSPVGLLTLLCLAAVAVVLARAADRPGWHDVAPVMVFVVLGLVAQRNLPVAAIAAAPAVGRALRSRAGASPQGAMRRREGPLNLALAGALAALAAGYVVVGAQEPGLDLDGYPVAAEAAVAEGTRLVTTDVAAGYRILRRGDGASVFIDDRFDMFPAALTEEYVRLFEGRPDALAILDRHGAEAVLWPVDAPLAAQLRKAEGWRRAQQREGWVLYVRRAGG